MDEETGLLKDARRLLAVNAGEQKRLEKLQRHIEKKRREKERMLSRAQREAVIKFYENAGKELSDFLLVEKVPFIHNREDEVGQQHVVPCVFDIKGQETISTETTTLKNVKDRQKRRHQKLAVQENESKDVLPGLELTVFSLKGGPQTRSRSWSSPSVGRQQENQREKLKHEEHNSQRKNSEEVGKDHFTKEEGPQIPEEKPEKPLSTILPPLILPPLRDHRRPSLQEYNKNFYKTGKDLRLNSKKTLKEQYDELAECRYLRVYQPKQN